MKIYRRNKHNSIRPLVVIGPLSMLLRYPDSERITLAGFHWRWSITWRWVVHLEPDCPKKWAFYARHNSGGGGWLKIWKGWVLRFAWQKNMPWKGVE